MPPSRARRRGPDRRRPHRAEGSRDDGRRRLLSGLEGDDRRERIELIAYLREEHGASEEELERGTANGTLVLVAAGRALGGGEPYSAQEVARRSGLPLDLWTALGRASGLPQPVTADVVHFGEVDLEAARTAKGFLDAGLVPEAVLTTNRVLSRVWARRPS